MPADRDAVGNFNALVREHEALLGLHQQYLDLYDRVAAGALSREDATRLLLDGIDAALPGTNESGSPLAYNIRLRQTLQRLATDIFDAGDRAEADKTFADTVVPSDNVEAIGELIFSILPVTGELISARDAYVGFAAAVAAARQGEAGEALREGGLATLATLGAIPLIGYLPRLGRGGVKAFSLVRQFLRRGRSRGDGGTRGGSRRIDDGNGSFGSAEVSVTGEEALAETIVNDPPSKPAFSWIHRGRHTTNRKLKKVWKTEENKDWPIDPETGRQQDVHHVIPLADAGPDHVSNIIPLTRNAHLDHHKHKWHFITKPRRSVPGGTDGYHGISVGRSAKGQRVRIFGGG